jgi:hypothetical protein
MTGLVVDANVMQAFTRSMICQSESVHRQLVLGAASSVGFVVDVGDKMLQEWKNTCGRTYFEEWLFQQIKLGIVRYIDPNLDQAHIKRLRQDCGFPTHSGKDLTYIKVAYTAAPHVIVTEDMDFHEPAAKGRNSQQKRQIVEAKSGSVCKYLLKRLGIRVCSPEEGCVMIATLLSSPAN